MQTVITADALQGLKTLPDGVADMCVTSPPYFGLRNYGVEGQIGIEKTPEEYIQKLVAIFYEVKRVLHNDGTLWLNIGDSYWNSNGFARTCEKFKREGMLDAPANDRKLPPHPILKVKDLIGIPWMLAFALRADGWYLRQDIIWHKPNPMPESVTDRCTKAHEYIFLLSKSERYYFDNNAIKEPTLSPPTLRNKNAEGYQANYAKGERFSQGTRIYGADGVKNKRDVWTINLKPSKESHFAVFPPDLIRPCILAGSRNSGVVLDPFFGSGTTGVVAVEEGRNYIGIELNPSYVERASKRIREVVDKLSIKEETLF